ncbi:head-to-tail stopper [Gordonia phage Nyceirae]|uniref:Head-to-tail stopper n=1 Tax=Gordonia phage Nyceirae TaxID=1887651 RepID=A0A1C9EHZ1_9CAUD|nr:head-tail connector protein [Gordonia phage Nyceirae]AON97377.1 head-to-tail stopper [Gordonia phage Nyceirae]
MLRFPERWEIRAPRTTTTDVTTGNPVPGPRPTPVEVNGSLEQRFPDSDQREVGEVIADQRVLVLEPAAKSKVAGGITKQHQAIGPDGTVWSIVRVPVPRKRRRPSAPIRYLALVVRRSTDIKEN